ncbi:peptide chain release factor N(5)-glutamine methyltransferase [Colwellia sp. RSH04]|uniref:peptide chain release factor N(5)-glutamine methyltransferase n=1 Tax=Colwellia sp. RSH04 TaxID=2305464 RepID=UPI000E56ADE8|nr:peptide chain release factor N(5)-glutamine methyltransferase [Colwellia sp. RSH04]RHW75431.1 peptide chain release factor N(5)-glutamine methyltransferase [Colwellia sp. RSH04]
MSVDVPSIAALSEYGKQQLLSLSDSAQLDSNILICHVINKDLSYLLTWPEKKLSLSEYEKFIELLNRRIKGEPIAYIVGTKEFWSLPLLVSPATLIPRPDTETLVELVLELYQSQQALHCLDLGTGTGAIALALASENPSWHFDAVDFSSEAVSLAKLNSQQLNLTNVQVFQSDWYSNVAEDKKYDLIVSNPPYIDEQDEHLAQGDVRFEPKSALVADEQGLKDIKIIIENAKQHLKTNGALFIEHGFAQGELVCDILTGFGYQNAQTVTDLNGQDRISWAIYSNY